MPSLPTFLPEPTRPALYRLLYYVTLALAGMCLTCAEQQFVPELWMGLIPYLFLLGLAWWGGERFQLSLWASNVLGLVIAAGTGSWLWSRLASGTDVWAQDVPISAVLVPYLGPVTMALLVVRSFRSAQGDFWLVQGMGLLQVALGCVLATGPFFGALFLVYLVCGLALLWAHQLSLPSSRRILLGGAAWAVVVAGLAVPCYLLTPRGESQEWDPFQRFGVRKNARTTGQTGHSDDMDLTRSGVLERDERAAFTVTATEADGRPKVDLPANQRWRGVVLEVYDSGRWTSNLRLPGMTMVPRPVGEIMDGPPEAYHLTFTVQPRRAGGLFLAEPVRLGPKPGVIPVRTLEPAGPRQPALFFESAGTILPLSYLMQPECRYRQAVDPSWPRDRVPAERLNNNHLMELVHDRVPGMAEWTHVLLRRLIALPQNRRLGIVLPEPVEGKVGRVPERHWHAVATLLSDHLAHSGEYGYTLDLRRQETAIDPVMDFLQNVKEGHCERYATALALMLRSQGIPTRVAKGFRGAEHQGGGVYVVRHSHAHAWVELLVPRDDPRQYVFDWLILDPTPDLESPAAPFSLARLLWQGQRSGQDLWRDLVVEYNASAQASLWSRLLALSGQGIRWPLLLLGGVGVVMAGALLLRWRWRRGVPKQGISGLYRRLMALLSRHVDLPQEPSQTPQERAAAAALVLAQAPETAPYAELPGRVVALLYRSRYGARPAELAEEQELGRQLDALAGVLPRASLTQV